MHIFAIMVLLCWNFKNAFTEELPPEIKEMIKGLHDNCVEATGAKEESIVAVNNGNFSTEPELKCYMKCVFETIGVMDELGVVDFPGLIDLVPPHMAEYAKKASTKCVIPSNGDGCETAYKFNKCLYELDSKTYMLF